MESSRISLRPFKLSDADDFFKWASDDRVTQYLRWNSFTTREEALKNIQEVAIPHPWRRAICLDDICIGYISVMPEFGNDRHRANIGYALNADFWELGIATIATKMTIPLVFKELPYVGRLQALVEEENKGSQRVLEKVGFSKEGLMRQYGYHKGRMTNIIMYSFLSSDEIVV